MLNTILNDIKDIKNNYKEKYTITYRKHESNNANEPLLKEHYIELNQGIDDKFIDSIIDNCTKIFGVKRWKSLREEDYIRITFDYSDANGNIVSPHTFVDQYLWQKLGKKKK